MKLQEIYERDIFREINPAVTVSDKKEKTVDAEIKEYVFTDELIEKLFQILNTVLNKKSGKTGIWINGYYGSGKSHYIKYVHYLLDPQTSDLAFEYLEKAVKSYDATKAGSNDDITQNNIRLLKKRVDGSSCDNILFNVEDETDDNDQERLTRIFLNMFNKFRGFNANDIPLALLLEKPLAQQGKLEEFKKEIEKETGFNWDVDAADVAAFQLQDVLDIAKKLYPSFDIVSLHSKLSNPESYKIGINATLIPELKGFLKDKDKNYRLLFLVDEVSQYIGTNKEVLLNFQNIIERVSDDLNNQVWIACTAQQTLDEVGSGVDGMSDLQDEFGKILGRFDTRISLQSNDASYITQRRVLDKNSIGVEYLVKLYQENKDYIENQFKINHDLFKGYRDEEEFVIGYPFIPYQFKLIAHVFEAFQQLKFVIKEVKDNERSVLGITHFTAKKHADDEVGGFLPFDAFFNKQFRTNLTNRGAKAIENAFQLSYVKDNEFAQRVVKVLFMISNLLENQRQTFPSNLENLGVLLMNTMDANKMQIQKDTLKVLEKLQAESIIREEKGSYFFFNEDEMDVQNLIKGQVVGMDDRLKYFDEIFRPIIQINQKFAFGQNDFKMGYAIEGKEFLRNGDFDLTVLLNDTTPLQQKALDIDKKQLVICLNEWYTDDKTFKTEFDWYCKTNKYFINQAGSSTGERSKTNSNFQSRNSQLRTKLSDKLRDKTIEARYLSLNQVIESDQVNGATPKDRMKNMIEKHLDGIYKNHKLSQEYARNQAELKRSAADKQIPAELLTPAEQMVNDFISANNNQITVHDLIAKFEKEPFGWRFEAVLDVLVQLVKKKKREFVYKGQPRYPVIDFINKAVSTAERMSCEVVSGEEIDQSILDNVIKAYKEIFNETLPATTDKNVLYENLLDSFEKKLKWHNDLEDLYYGKYPFGNCFKTGAQQVTSWSQTRNIKKLFSDIIEEQPQAKVLFDQTKGMEDFLRRAFKEYQEIAAFVREENDNVKMLGDDDLEKVKKINTFLTEEDPRNDFRHIRKAYEEVKKALNAKLRDLKAETIALYEQVFDELEKEAEKKEVEPAAYANREFTLKKLKGIDSLSALKNKFLDVQNFKSQELEKIIAAVPSTGGVVREAKTYYMNGKASTIETEEELDEYLKQVRSEMLALLNDNKTIILK